MPHARRDPALLRVLRAMGPDLTLSEWARALAWSPPGDPSAPVPRAEIARHMRYLGIDVDAAEVAQCQERVWRMLPGTVGYLARRAGVRRAMVARCLRALDAAGRVDVVCGTWLRREVA